jgi:hypothetical protein
VGQHSWLVSGAGGFFADGAERGPGQYQALDGTSSPWSAPWMSYPFEGRPVYLALAALTHAA